MKKKHKGLSVISSFTLLFMAVSVVPLIILGVILADTYHSQALSRFESGADSALQSAHRSMEYELGQIVYHSLALSMNQGITNYYDSMTDAKTDEVLLKTLENDVKKQLYNYSTIPGISSVYLYFWDTGEWMYYKDGNYTRQFSGDMEELTAFVYGIKNYMYFDVRENEGETVVPYLRRLYNEQGRFFGIEFINIDVARLRELFSGTEDTEYSFLVLNENDSVIYSSEHEKINYREYAGLVLSEDAASGRIAFGEGSYIYRKLCDTKSGLTFYCYAPDSVIYRDFNSLLLLTIGICGVCLVICCGISIMMSRVISRPITRLISQISRKGESAARMERAMSYADMMAMLGDTITSYNSAEEEKRAAQMKALMFQINPHFLYNTLASVIWLCDEGENDRAAELTEILSNYFRLSISKGADVVSLNDELLHAENYLKILEIRYADRFKTSIRCEDALRSLPVPKLIIQPLLENSIYHGIKETEDNCNITIDCQMERESLIIRVVDDAGMLSAEKASELNEYLAGESMRSGEYGIGIANVNARVRLFAGESSGLRFFVDGKNTVAEMKICYQKGERADV